MSHVQRCDSTCDSCCDSLVGLHFVAFADVAAIPNFLSVERWGAKFSGFPNLAKYLTKIKVRMMGVYKNAKL